MTCKRATGISKDRDYSSVTIEKTQDVSTNLELTNTYGKERDLKHAVYETFHIDSGLDF